MLQVRWFITFLIVLVGTSAAAMQDASSPRQAAIAEAKKVNATQASKPPVVPGTFPSSGHPAHPVALNRHALMITQHADIASALTPANIPSSGKAYSFPALSKASFLAPANARSEVFPEPKAPHINTRKLRMAKPPDVHPVR